MAPHRTDLMQTTDAHVWAEAWMAETDGDCGVETMVTWFASAILAGMDEARRGMDEARRAAANQENQDVRPEWQRRMEAAGCTRSGPEGTPYVAKWSNRQGQVVMRSTPSGLWLTRSVIESRAQLSGVFTDARIHGSEKSACFAYLAAIGAP